MAELAGDYFVVMGETPTGPEAFFAVVTICAPPEGHRGRLVVKFPVRPVEACTAHGANCKRPVAWLVVEQGRSRYFVTSTLCDHHQNDLFPEAIGVLLDLDAASGPTEADEVEREEHSAAPPTGEAASEVGDSDG